MEQILVILSIGDRLLHQVGDVRAIFAEFLEIGARAEDEYASVPGEIAIGEKCRCAFEVRLLDKAAYAVSPYARWSSAKTSARGRARAASWPTL